MKFITQYEYEPLPGEVNTGEIITLPDEALTIEQLFKKAVQGTLPVTDNGLVYDEREIESDDAFLNDLSSLNFQDPIDRLTAMDYLEDYKSFLESKSRLSPQETQTSNNEVVEETTERSGGVSESNVDTNSK